LKLLDGKLYDPAAAVNKVTTALVALTALDTANLRLTVVIPKSGKILVRLGGQLHGATTMPAIVLGVLEGAAVRGRRAPMVGGGNLAATGIYSVECEFLITGLVPGNNITLDAAYGVETLVAATGLKYGGPNNATANDNFGGFQFELWDPDPYVVDATGNVAADVKKWLTVAPNALVASRVDASVGAMAANVLTAAAINAAALNGKGDWNIGKTGYTLTQTFPANFSALSITAGGLADITQAAADKAWGTAARLLTAGTNIVLAKGVGVTGFNDLDAAGVRGAVGLAAANLDGQLAAVDADVLTRLATAGYTAPDNAGVAAIKAKTDSLNFTVAGKLDANVMYVNGVQVIGAGTAIAPWGPV